MKRSKGNQQEPIISKAHLTDEEAESWRRLEEASKTYKPKQAWSEQEVAKLKKFYGHAPKEVLVTELHHGWQAISDKANKLGLRVPKD